MDEGTDPTVFVRLEEAKDIADLLVLMREKIDQAKGLLSKAQQIKVQEAELLDSWQAELADVESKVGDIDHALTHR